MNALETYCAETGTDPDRLLTWLQTEIPNSPVSDLCKTIGDVWHGDAERAVERIREEKARVV